MMDCKPTGNSGDHRWTRAGARLLAACLLACLLAGAASAYTLVMRGGRRVEIPEAFELTRATLTYEAAPGVNITLPLDHVDVEATERANGEPAGGFFRRARQEGTSRGQATAAPAVAARTLTNRELEAARRARVESERSYELRRKELGLPSAEEMRLRAEREDRFMHELAVRQAEEEAAFERYRRALAAEIEAGAYLGAEADYLRRSLSELPDGPAAYFPAGALTLITTDGRQFGGRRPYGKQNYGRQPYGRQLFPPGFRTSPFAPLHPANFGAFGARRGPRARVGASVGIGVGSRAVVGFGRGVRRGGGGHSRRR